MNEETKNVSYVNEKEKFAATKNKIKIKLYVNESSWMDGIKKSWRNRRNFHNENRIFICIVE